MSDRRDRRASEAERKLIFSRGHSQRWRGWRRRQQREYWLRDDEVPEAHVVVEPAAASLFGRFNAFRSQYTHGAEHPIDFDVLLTRDEPRGIAVLMRPSRAVKAVRIGRLTPEDAPHYCSVFDHLDPDQVLIGALTARLVGSHEYAAIVRGLSPEGLRLRTAERPNHPPLT